MSDKSTMRLLIPVTSCTADFDTPKFVIVVLGAADAAVILSRIAAMRGAEANFQEYMEDWADVHNAEAGIPPELEDFDFDGENCIHALDCGPIAHKYFNEDWSDMQSLVIRNDGGFFFECHTDSHNLDTAVVNEKLLTEYFGLPEVQSHDAATVGGEILGQINTFLLGLKNQNPQIAGVSLDDDHKSGKIIVTTRKGDELMISITHTFAPAPLKAES